MITSANTSINKNKVPALFKMVEWEPGTVNVDYGAGKYDTASEYLLERHVWNFSVDPYNRTHKENLEAQVWIECAGGADTVTCSNVLNVIQNKKDRFDCIFRCWEMLKYGGTAYFTVYEGDKSGIGRQTGKDQWQENRKTEDYIREILEVFPTVWRRGKLIIAR